MVRSILTTTRLFCFNDSRLELNLKSILGTTDFQSLRHKAEFHLDKNHWLYFSVCLHCLLGKMYKEFSSHVFWFKLCCPLLSKIFSSLCPIELVSTFLCLCLKTRRLVCGTRKYAPRLFKKKSCCVLDSIRQGCLWVVFQVSPSSWQLYQSQ